MIMYKCKIMTSVVRLENFFKVFGQNMSIENLNSMLSYSFRWQPCEYFSLI